MENHDSQVNINQNKNKCIPKNCYSQQELDHMQQMKDKAKQLYLSQIEAQKKNEIKSKQELEKNNGHSFIKE